MSDLLLPFLLLMDDDAMVFWCFVALMQRLGLRHNFAVDESGIFGQLRRLGQVSQHLRWKISLAFFFTCLFQLVDLPSYTSVGGPRM